MSQQPGKGPLIGQKGVQYGLQKVVPKKPVQLANAPAGKGTAPPRKLAPGNVLGDDDSEEEDVERQIARQAEKKRAAAKVQQMYEDALAQDPNAFDYDGVYDSIQQARVEPKQKDKVERQSKYIASLLEQANARKREQDVLYERRMVKERQQEDHLYEDKEKFVTSAYRRKLEEDKKWQEEERKREAEEAKQDVRKVGHMGNFYANLLTKNVAYGTAKTEEGEKPPSQERDDEAEERGGRGSRSPGPGPGSKEAAKDRSASPAADDAPGPSAKVLSQLDRYDILRLEAEKALRAKKGREQEQGARSGSEDPDAGAGGGGREEQERGPGQGERAGPRREEERKGGRSGSALPTEDAARGAQAEGRAAPAAAPGQAGAAAEALGAGGDAGPGGKRRNDDQSVMSARERYLARKQQKLG
ncbi:hypothetical protein HYH03_018537 [Edaphochlamys debaryana]|uniref:Nuclear speckle splicing regulatory protein 1 N-terminal domain-containing protein n=1 Tax=Edaphochlamys debaryana TaxID=47281 RepID=A0A836BMV1_9CHLO|nr:hypothetical protein HYH03_018537 [Edaphochlamys debaryana]|eukprot:KAG2482546.1 hypothetical protein HYH03_018537 [Edaphochlamys debaryana]